MANKEITSCQGEVSKGCFLNKPQSRNGDRKEKMYYLQKKKKKHVMCKNNQGLGGRRRNGKDKGFEVAKIRAWSGSNGDKISVEFRVPASVRAGVRSER